MAIPTDSWNLSRFINLNTQQWADSYRLGRMSSVEWFLNQECIDFLRRHKVIIFTQLTGWNLKIQEPIYARNQNFKQQTNPKLIWSEKSSSIALNAHIIKVIYVLISKNLSVHVSIDSMYAVCEPITSKIYVRFQVAHNLCDIGFHNSSTSSHTHSYIVAVLVYLFSERVII